MAFGQDLTRTYHRVERVFDPTPEDLTNIFIADEKKEKYSWNRPTRCHKHGAFFFRQFSIAFCGKIYKGIRVTQTKRVKGIDPNPVLSEFIDTWVGAKHCFYNVYDIAKLMARYNQDWFIKEGTNKYRRWSAREKSYFETMKEYFGNSPDKSHLNIFVARKLPIVVWDIDAELIARRDYVITENPSLKKYEFYKVMDACTTYQELDMFISGMMAAENNPMAAISDGQKAYQHGFDCRSFRKDATKHEIKPCTCVPK